MRLKMIQVDDETCKEAQKVFIKKECDMAEANIRKNFANFSAWHYRGKLMPILYEDMPGLSYILPLEKIKSELEMLKHALYTDPKDQSSWNYHDWLISLLLPIQVVSVSARKAADSVEVVIGLSQKVKDFGKLAITVTGADGSHSSVEVLPRQISKASKAR